jgi:type IV pilus biogenesis protein CpaD/CtpE
MRNRMPVLKVLLATATAGLATTARLDTAATEQRVRAGRQRATVRVLRWTHLDTGTAANMVVDG